MRSFLHQFYLLLDKSPETGWGNIFQISLVGPVFKSDITLVNGRLGNEFFQKLFKLAKIVPILKPGKDVHSPKSHRLNGIGKFFENLILSRLND